MVSVNKKSTCCECENITHIPGLISKSRYCAMISTRKNMYDASFWKLSSFFLSPPFLKGLTNPFSLCHCHSQYINYNIYLSMSRNCLLTINKTNSPNFANIFLCQDIFLFPYDYQIKTTLILFLKKSSFEAIELHCNGFIQKYFLSGQTSLPFIYHDREYVLN